MNSEVFVTGTVVIKSATDNEIVERVPARHIRFRKTEA
jgi:hypothetical protein